jgi:hypothetical protein
MDNNEQVIDSTTTETQQQEVELNLDNVSVEEETIESLKIRLEEAEAQLVREAEARRQLTARAKAAEAKPAQVVKPQINSTLDETMIEKKILKSQGMSDELIEELATLAKVRGKGLLDTQDDPIFAALKDAKEAEIKKSKATLGTSKGSGSVKASKDFNSPGLSEEEHKEMWKQSQGK